jgi:hypothetical protein
MNYQKIYDRFIADRKTRESDLVASGVYTERHHIVPRSMGGSNAKDNLVYLTAGDHFFAHLLLAKAYGGNMWFAANMMFMNGNKNLRNAKKTRVMREMVSKRHAEEKAKLYIGEKNPHFGKSHDAKTRKLISDIVKAKMTPEICARISEQRTGTKWSSETRNKLMPLRKKAGANSHMKDQHHRNRQSLISRGREITQEQKLRISAAKKGVPNPGQSQRLKERNWLATEEARKRQLANTKRGADNPVSRKVINLDTGELFETLTSAGKSVGLKNPAVSIWKVCKGEAKTAGGHRWAYVTQPTS